MKKTLNKSQLKNILQNIWLVLKLSKSQQEKCEKIAEA